MSATVWTNEMRSVFAKLRAGHPGRGVRWYGKELGVGYSTVSLAIRRLDGQGSRPEPRRPDREDTTPGRVCPCGKPVRNDWATDHRRCEPCRAGVAVAPVRFSEGARP